MSLELPAGAIEMLFDDQNQPLFKKALFNRVKAQYPHHRFIMKEQDNANGIHEFNRFEEKGYVERFQCHFRLVDIPRDALYTLTTLAILDDGE